MRRLLLLLSLLLLPVAAHADTFTVAVSGAGLPTTATLTGTSNGDGSYTITDIATSFPATVVKPDLTFLGDDLFFPTGASLLDTKGLTIFSAYFTDNIYSTGSGYALRGYEPISGFYQISPVSLTLVSSSVTPEPSSIVLSLTGLLALGAAFFLKRSTFQAAGSLVG